MTLYFVLIMCAVKNGGMFVFVPDGIYYSLMYSYISMKKPLHNTLYYVPQSDFDLPIKKGDFSNHLNFSGQNFREENCYFSTIGWCIIEISIINGIVLLVYVKCFL